jgi:hypothetical protein
MLGDVGSEARGDNTFEEFAKGVEEANGAVGYGVGRRFFGFLDRDDLGHFPGGREMT